MLTFSHQLAIGYAHYFCFVKRSLNLWVAAFAALSAFETQQADLVDGDSVTFDTFATETGSTGNFDGMAYTCPSTAFYFVYYRLLLRVFDPPCGVNLVVGGIIARQVIQFIHRNLRFCMKKA